MTTPNPTDADPRMQELYMKPDEYERMRTQLTQIETLFTKVKDGVFYYPKALHPMAVASKELMQTLDQLFPKESPYTGVSGVFSTTFSGIVAVYNETVNKGKNAVDVANKWFEHLRKAKNLVIQRDKYKKEYEHYLKKTAKMKVDREMKKARNPTGIETAKDSEWYTRNDRKLDNSRNSFIETSQQSYALAKECIKLRYQYMIPVLETFSKTLLTFFKTAGNAVSNLPEVAVQIEKGKEIQKERDTEERVRELKEEEAKLRKIQEEKERATREKLEREKAEQDRLVKELEEKQRELRAKSAAAESSQSYSTQPLNPTANYEESYYPDQGNDGYQDFYSEAKGDAYYTPRPSRPPQQDFYPTQDPYTSRPRPSHNQPSYPRPRPAPARQRPQPSYYEESYEDSYYEPPQPDYYTQPQPRPRPRPRPAPARAESYMPSESYESYQPQSYNDWPAPEPLQTYGRPAMSARSAYDDPFAEVFDQGGAGRKPRNPFTARGSARPPPAQNDQFDFLGF